MSSREIQVAAVVVRNAAGEVLCVRKRTSPRFQLPGGKIEPGESVVDAALRETFEETGLVFERDDLSFLGTFSAEASNEPGHTVTSTVFTASAPAAGAAPAPAAEIAELAWIAPVAPVDGGSGALGSGSLGSGSRELAPLLATRVFPALHPRALQAVTVFAGARDAADPAMHTLAYSLGAALARDGVTLVYGGSKLGLMGEVARGAHENGGATHGILTTHLANYELKYDDLDQFELVGTMAERKARMGELADGFIALPGGTGTLDELFDQWTGQQLGTHTKPIGLLGADFWRPLVEMVDHMVSHGFIRATDRAHLILADDPAELLAAMRAWVPPVPRWI